MADIAEIRRALCDPEWVAERLGLAISERTADSVTIRCPWHQDGGRPNCHVTRRGDGTLSAHCFSCQAGGDVLHLVGAVQGLTPGWCGGQGAPSREDMSRVIAACEDLMGGAAPPPPKQRPRKEEGYPPPSSVKMQWNSAVPVRLVGDLTDQLRGRGLSIDEVAALARGLLASTPGPDWACQGSARRRRPWGAVGYRLLLPLYDSSGHAVTLHARRFDAADGPPKGVSPTGYTVRGAVLACPAAVRMLRGEERPAQLLVAEGVPDFLTLATQGQGAAIGVISGSWSEAVAARVPDATPVVVWTHTDAARDKQGTPIKGAGQKYRDQVVRSLHPRCAVRVVVQERPDRGKAPDANDLLQAGGRAAVQLLLDSARPWTGDEHGQEERATRAGAARGARAAPGGASRGHAEGRGGVTDGPAAPPRSMRPVDEPSGEGAPAAPARADRHLEEPGQVLAAVEDRGEPAAASPGAVGGDFASTMADLEDRLPPPRAQRLATGARLVDPPGPPPDPPAPPPPEPPPGGGGGRRRKMPEEPWMEDVSYSRDGIRAEVGNVVRILGRHPAWAQLLRWNLFSQEIEFSRPAPFARPEGGPLDDDDVTRTRIWLSDQVHAYFGKELIADALPVLAQQRPYHPVKDYLAALEWDGQPRVRSWLAAYAGAADTPYTAAVGRWWLISMVARIREPGCKVDTVPILEGGQGRGKSTLCSVLAVRPEWFSDTEIELGTKDSRVALRGRWLIEFGEITSLSRREIDRAKQFLSQRDDKYRPPYGRLEVMHLRQNVFVGTLNPVDGEGYLRDPTGARRFWPVLLDGQIRLEELRRDLHQLWAEAVHLYEQGEPWWPSTTEERAACEEQQAERQELDPWCDQLQEWLEKSAAAHRQACHERFPEPERGCPICQRASSADALAAVGLPPQQQDVQHLRRIVRAMRQLGWVIDRPRTPTGQRLRVFVPLQP